jgi:hypothetical protein
MRYNIITLLGLLLAGVVSLFGCGGPPVKYSGIDGRVKTVSNWAVTWESDTTSVETSVSVVGLSERSRYTLPDYCRAYVEDVKHRLSADHNVPVYRNMLAEGTIAIRLFGQTVHKSVARANEAEILADELRGEREYMPGAGLAGDQKVLYFGKEDIVYRVEVTLHDLEENLLGKMFIGGETETKVKPEHVAAAIANAIFTGDVAGSSNE